MQQIFVVSDGTGRTAKQALNAALVQFPASKYRIIVRSKVRTHKRVEKIVEEARNRNAFIVHTLVRNAIRDSVIELCRINNVDSIDLMGPLLARLSEKLEVSPTEKPGLFEQLNKNYFRRIETMEFAIKHDDGMNLDHLSNAEIILLGVSRTFKTPLSIYLAYKGWFVANVPIISNNQISELVTKQPVANIFCLDTNARNLYELRRTRDTFWGMKGGEYTDFDFIRMELMHARKIFSRNPEWPIINVTNKPIEEIASEILAIKNKTENA